MEWWIIITLLAAVAQTLRSTVQRRMKPIIGDNAASYIRFLYAVPFAWAWAFGYSSWSGFSLPQINPTFLLWVVLASLMQILFTVLLIRLFSHRSFAAGTAFSKTEVLQAAIFEAVILGVITNLMTTVAIIIGVVAVMLLSLGKSSQSGIGLLRSMFTLGTAIGLASGAFLGLSTVLFKMATDALGDGDVLMRAAMAGAVSASFQMVAMGCWMFFSCRDELVASFTSWRQSSQAGLFGAIATACWFTAFALYAVAPVRAVGQVELLITLGISIGFFREQVSRREIIAMALLALSIILVLLS